MELNKESLEKIEKTVTLLRKIEKEYSPSVFSSSLSAEDMVITDIIAKYTDTIEIITLDTGRLPPETYSMIERIKENYGIYPKTYFPDTKDLEPFLNEHGPNAFYTSITLRKKCCEIRKILPLKRALFGKKSWITGMRRQHSSERKDIPLSYFDTEHQVHKFNPLIDWSTQDVWDYIRYFKVPYHPLHDRNYPSIGCAPCTRSIQIGEDMRAGRWWWEGDDARKECGIHLPIPAESTKS